MTVDKSAIRSDLDKAWKDLSSLVDSIPERELMQPGVVEEWSVKDLFGHMAFWANKAATDLEALTTGAERKIETPGSEKAVDEWNAREAAARRANRWESCEKIGRQASKLLAQPSIRLRLTAWNSK